MKGEEWRDHSRAGDLLEFAENPGPQNVPTETPERRKQGNCWQGSWRGRRFESLQIEPPRPRRSFARVTAENDFQDRGFFLSKKTDQIIPDGRACLQEQVRRLLELAEQARRDRARQVSVTSQRGGEKLHPSARLELASRQAAARIVAGLEGTKPQPRRGGSRPVSAEDLAKVAWRE